MHLIDCPCVCTLRGKIEKKIEKLTLLCRTKNNAYMTSLTRRYYNSE